jgi:SAM-dependent methyltransferase
MIETANSAVQTPSLSRNRCPCCGSEEQTSFMPVMWPELGEEWGLSSEEYAYVDQQQGCRCASCKVNLRTRALARAVLQTLKVKGAFRDFARSIRGRLLRILEINEAGDLTRFFPHRSRHHLMRYPDLDMMAMRTIADNSYDLVIHSDTLEHVPDPVRGLSECCRVLKPGGACCFTVPIIVGRLTRSRKDLPPSYHGGKGQNFEDFLVQTEYGADAWRQVLQAGFAECRIVTEASPAAHALVGVKAL